MTSSNKRQKIEEEVMIVYKQGANVPKNITKVIFDASVVEIPDGSHFHPRCIFQLQTIEEG